MCSCMTAQHYENFINICTYNITNLKKKKNTGLKKFHVFCWGNINYKIYCHLILRRQATCTLLCDVQCKKQRKITQIHS